MTDDQARLDEINGAIVRVHAERFGFVKADTSALALSYAWVTPIYGESPAGDWQGTMHEPLPGWKATNIHVSDSWVLSVLTEQYGKCYRVLDSDIHFFSDRPVAEIEAWMRGLPARDARPPARARIAGYPYGLRDGNPHVDEGDYAIEHIPGRPDCHYYNHLKGPNAGGKSGSPAFAVVEDSPLDRPFGINVARGSTWMHEEGRLNHWAVIQCYHSAMRLEAAA